MLAVMEHGSEDAQKKHVTSGCDPGSPYMIWVVSMPTHMDACSRALFDTVAADASVLQTHPDHLLKFEIIKSASNHSRNNRIIFCPKSRLLCIV